ncbi:MAG: acyl-CoA dehydrogenase C-terminal domain-containing protein [Pseudomonadales bacterium]|nr:acyl-CoA dehydrogenase C-terminal domain-containing protein [Pseudomonadales bacterium]
MPAYKAPRKDIDFVMNELFDFEAHYEKLSNGDAVSRDIRDAILNEAVKFCEQVLAPLHQSGDEEGCHWSPEGVTTPAGFVDAYKEYVDGGWASITMPEEFDGQNLPHSLNLAVGELMGQANHAWAMITALSSGARQTLIAHGSKEQQETYLPKLVSGEWTGTMCLTEPQCGSDLSFLKTRAENNNDGSYSITGTKIFISGGDHDYTDNIVHIVLARVPGAPEGTKGISLFVVPKRLPQADGSLVDNAVSCGSLENKMGIHANPTCVMNFDGSKAFLIGEENRGLNCMFTFMNSARLDTSLQGLTHSELALQGAMSYALDREAGRSLSGIKAPERPADPLMVHPDVRRMILTIKSFSEGSRAFIYYLAQLSDLEKEGDKLAGKLMGLLTPISKGFLTECGIEAANLGVQVYGGHGYIREWGMEQNVRDARIATLYEGTTGIQSMDLLGRKVLLDGAQTLNAFIDIIQTSLPEIDAEFQTVLQSQLTDWQTLTQEIMAKAGANIDELGASAFDYLMYSGYIITAWMWGRMASVALVNGKSNDSAFYRLKVETARFYFQKILPRAHMHKMQIESGSSSVMGTSMDDFRESIA